ncbi:hypothetical protein LCGC14_1902650 [marine sediment metagenome]|uniref:Uncharacterized protein n=1 Tax=marine sediment metagenome TaxID=412755 RepID=A0A0F9IU61_9ZZZZ
MSRPGQSLTRKQVREVDRLAIEQWGVPGVVLMENAGDKLTLRAIKKLVGIKVSDKVYLDALDELEAMSRDNEVLVYCENPAERNRFMELISSAHPALAGKVQTAIGHVHRGFHWVAEKLLVVGHHELFHRYARPHRLRRVRAGRPIDSFVDATPWPLWRTNWPGSTWSWTLSAERAFAGRFGATSP